MGHPRGVCAALIGAGVVVCVARGGDGSGIVLVEGTVDAGLGHVHMTVSTAADLEFQCAGGAVGDFDRDGDQDLFVVGGSAGVDRLFWNNGDGTFVEGGAAAGVARTHRGSGACVGDVDGDGDLDLYVTSIGVSFIEAPHQNRLYLNNGDGTFTDATFDAGVATNNPARGDAHGSAFGDYDLDGDLDLAVAGWHGGNVLFRNDTVPGGGVVFTNVTGSALGDVSGVRGFSPKFVDMDGDRYPELLWVGDFFTSRYFVNNGDGTFSDATMSSGTGLDSNGMGNAVGDFDNDGLMDWYVTSRINAGMTSGSGNMLYRATGVAHVYAEESVARGANFGWWGWGTEGVDFDQDGDLDIIATNGFTGTFAGDPTVLFVNDGTGFFEERAEESGVLDPGQGRGLLRMDLENDGDQDVVIIRNRQALGCFRNETVGGGSITLFFDTSGVGGLAPDGYGTRVESTVGGVTRVFQLTGGSNYLAQSELSVHIGIGGAGSADLVITYADGSAESLVGVGPGRYVIEARSCAADFSVDGVLDFFDLSSFLMKLASGHPQADLSGDGSFDFFDVSAFLGAYSSGCP